jgi:hypothetical protein
VQLPGPNHCTGSTNSPDGSGACSRRNRRGSHGFAGVAVGTPNAYYLAAIAAILKSGVGAGTQVVALVVFNVVAFAQAEVPLVGFLIAPEATRTRVQQLYTWISSHQRWILTVLTGVVGIYLVVVGASKL